MKGMIFGAVIATLLSGCVYKGTNFDESKLANVHKRETTKLKVISYFGNNVNAHIECLFRVPEIILALQSVTSPLRGFYISACQ